MTPAPVVVIRASALRNNLQVVRTAAPGCRVLAVVKANAYGHGIVTVARILSEADGFAVARIEEALQLRDAGIEKRVVVLGGFVTADEVQLAAARNLDLVIHSLEQIDIIEEMSIANVDFWIKVDTGMGRLGLEPELIAEAVQRLAAQGVAAGSLRLMTHLADADRPSSAINQAQLARFQAIADRWSGDISVANSAAILQSPAAVARSASGQGNNWVRPGLMLYGASPVAGQPAAAFGLQPAMSFETRLIAVRHLGRGRRVGYGGEWQAARDSVVAIAAAGYADGYPWHVCTVTPALVNGARAPVIGRVSMDMVCIDVTDLPPCRAGDRVVLWGDNLPAEEIAGHAETIVYELLAAISPRVIRHIDE